MAIDPITSIFELGKTAIEKIWPDANKRAEEMRKLEEMRQSGDLARLELHVQLMLAQLEVNKAEAEHPKVFVAGWRPFIGWTGGFSLKRMMDSTCPSKKKERHAIFNKFAYA